MNDRHKAFVENYLINGYNATQAYLKAYPKAANRTAEVNGNKLLSNAEIKTYIQSKQQETAQRNSITKDDIIAVLASIMYNGASKDTDRIKAASELNKMNGFNAPIEQNINMNIEQPLFGDLENEDNE